MMITPPALAVLLLFLLRLVSATTEITCANVSATTLEKFASPWISVARWYLHTNCTSVGAFDTSTLSLATWPRYANITAENEATVHLTGYAHGVPICAASGLNRLLWFSNLLELTGHSMNGSLDYTVKMMKFRPDYDPESEVPVDYLSFPVVGASLVLRANDGNEIWLPAHTNAYGHFDRTEIIHLERGPTDSPLDSTVDLLIGGCNESLRASWTTVPIRTFPARGLTVVADVDDILRPAEVWDWSEALRDLFLKPFKPWKEMPKILWEWRKTVPHTHFHYVTDAPEMSHAYYTDGLRRWYPGGTYDFRSMRLDNLAQVMSPRYDHVRRLIESFPKRRFVLIGDTSTGSVLSAYSRLEKEFPDAVQCIIIRNVTATEPANWIIPNLAQMPKNKTMIFKTLMELKGMEKLMKGLESGEDSGCGAWTGQGWDGVKVYGSFESWVLTLYYGMHGWFRCALLMEMRPAPYVCPLDQRIWTYEMWNPRWRKLKERVEKKRALAKKEKEEKAEKKKGKAEKKKAMKEKKQRDL